MTKREFYYLIIVLINDQYLYIHKNIWDFIIFRVLSLILYLNLNNFFIFRLKFTNKIKVLLLIIN